MENSQILNGFSCISPPKTGERPYQPPKIKNEKYQILTTSTINNHHNNKDTQDRI